MNNLVKQFDIWLDRVRIQRHLECVERELRHTEDTHLTADQRASRAALLDHLGRYWRHGVFPHNPGNMPRTPIFVDDGGRMCAVAHLMFVSGQGDIVEIGRREANLERVPRMQFPQLDDWAVKSGFTRGELALIQPSYGSLIYSASVHTPILWLSLMGLVLMIASVIKPLRNHARAAWALPIAFLVVGGLLFYARLGWGFSQISDATFSCAATGCPDVSCEGAMCESDTRYEIRYYMLDPLFTGTPTIVDKQEGMFRTNIYILGFFLAIELLAMALLAIGLVWLARLLLVQRYGPDVFTAHRSYRPLITAAAVLLVVGLVSFGNWPSLAAVVEKAAPDAQRNGVPGS